MVGMKTEKAYRGILETLKGCRKTIEKYRCRDGREPFQVQSTGWGGFFLSQRVVLLRFQKIVAKQKKKTSRSMIDFRFFICEIRLNVLNLRKCLKSRKEPIFL